MQQPIAPFAPSADRTAPARRRRAAASAFLGLALLAASGCANKQDPEERERWTDREWKQALRENEQRLKTEDEREATSRFAPFTKVTATFTDRIRDLYNFITGDTPFNAAKAILDPASADRRRDGVVYLAKRDYGRQDPYVAYYAEMARTDEDFTVRAMAVRALNRSRDEEAVQVFINALEDPNAAVRLEAAKALANVPSAESIPALVKHLNNPEETADVRIAAADALRNHRDAQAAQALVRVLRDRDFGVSWQARRSLKLMTGKDYRYDQSDWLEYLSAEQFG